MDDKAIEAIVSMVMDLQDRENTTRPVLESSKEDLEIRIANEKIAKPKISAEFVTFWLHKFCKLDINRQDHRKWLVNVFVNAICL